MRCLSGLRVGTAVEPTFCHGCDDPLLERKDVADQFGEKRLVTGLSSIASIEDLGLGIVPIHAPFDQRLPHQGHRMTTIT
jgi:hypothetical protein